MTSKKKFFQGCKNLPVDKFFNKVLYDKKIGYYSSKLPLGKTGDFITSPGISNLFSEIIGIWLISAWVTLGKPKNFNIIELGPGDGKLTKILLKTFKQFPEFNKIAKIFLYEKSNLLRDIQKKTINSSKVKWIRNFTNIKKGPIFFFGNEFFDAIPIKQFSLKKNVLFEKHYFFNKQKNIVEIYKKANLKDTLLIKNYKSLKNLKFLEFPKLGFDELNKIIEKISRLSGGILLLDYGYLKSNNKNTLQSVMRHKKNNILENLGKADVTSLVNFDLLNEHFVKNNLKVQKIVSQSFFLQKMGIVERANDLSKKMNFREKSNLYFRIRRLLDIKLMGGLFKVIFAHNFTKEKFIGFK